MTILALDIGGTAVKYGFFDKEAVFGEFSVKDSNGNESLPEKILNFISTYKSECIGICVPGPFDFETGTSHMEHKLKSMYNVSLRAMIEKEFKNINLFFIHDSTAFVLGAIQKNYSLSRKNIAGVMLGTGLGYVHCINGKIEANRNKTPLRPLWNKPYKDGIAENYVSATAIIKKADSKGYNFKNVKEIAIEAQNGNKDLQSIFFETGEQLGEMIEIKRKEDCFDSLVIGGQVSGAWDLMLLGFENYSDIPYSVISDPAVCPLFGIKYCAENGIENIYNEREI